MNTDNRIVPYPPMLVPSETPVKQIAGAPQPKDSTVANHVPGTAYDVTHFVPIPDNHLPLTTLPDDAHNFDHFKLYIKSKPCYDATPLSRATIMTQKECAAFRVDLWTLMEHRTVAWHTRPYRGDPVPGKDVGDPFSRKGFAAETPRTTIKKKCMKSFPLTDTQSKIVCTLCSGTCKQQCDSCHGGGQVSCCMKSSVCSHCHGSGEVKCGECGACGYLLRWATLNITWHSIESVSCYQDEKDTFLPENIIRKLPRKPVFYENDLEWNNDIFLLGYGTLFQTIGESSPVDFGTELQKQYQSHYIQLQDSMVIRRIKCLIRRVDMIRTDYQLDDFVNRSQRNKGEQNHL